VDNFGVSDISWEANLEKLVNFGASIFRLIVDW